MCVPALNSTLSVKFSTTQKERLGGRKAKRERGFLKYSFIVICKFWKARFSAGPEKDRWMWDLLRVQEGVRKHAEDII